MAASFAIVVSALVAPELLALGYPDIARVLFAVGGVGAGHAEEAANGELLGARLRRQRRGKQGGNDQLSEQADQNLSHHVSLVG